MRRLTTTHLNALRSTAHIVEIPDPECPGLMLHVAARLADGSEGMRSWQFRFRWRGGRQKLTLGAYPDVPLATAHDLVREARTLISKGIDPRASGLSARARAPRVVTTAGDGKHAPHSVDALAQEFMRRYVTPNRKRPEGVQWALDKYVLSKWSGRDARTITPREVIELLHEIVDRGSRVQANRVAAIVRQMFTFGVQLALVESSPVQLLMPPGGKERPRQRALSDKELVAFLRDPVKCTRYPRLAHVIKILLLTGARRGELAAARWRDVSFSSHTWTIPAEHAKNGRECVQPLSAAAEAEFRALRKLADADGGSPWVLPGTDTAQSMDAKRLTRGLAKCLRRFKAVGVAPFRLHDLRRTMRTGLARLKVEPHIAERVLNHVQPGVGGVYDVHAYAEEKRTALDKWADHLQGLVANAKV